MGLALTPRRVMAARVLAVVADAVQIGLLPMFVGGALSPINDVLDVLVAIAMVLLIGWHWAFLPAFLSEVIPVFDLVPTWTAAVLIVTRSVPLLPRELPPAPPAPAAPSAPPRTPEP